MGAIFVRGTEHLLQYGAGIALPIAALGLFVGLRAWSVKITTEIEAPNQSKISIPSELTIDPESSRD